MYDVAIVGGGCIGLSIAKHLAEPTELDVAVLEKEYHLAQHQSGRNSGVLHPGFNYEPGSLKAKFSTEGTGRMKAFCREHDVALEEYGVVVVATDDEEERRLADLQAQAQENGVETTILDGEGLRDHEPHAAGQAALYCPAAASVDAQQYVYTLAGLVEGLSVDIYRGHAVTGVDDRRGGDGHVVETTGGDVEAAYLVNAAGLQADRIAHRVGVGRDYRVVPFRGTYYELVPDCHHLVESMIYPVPHPEYPFLGVHYTRRSDDKVIVGPNAALAFGREAYGPTEFDLSDLAAVFSYPGFWRMLTSPTMLRAAVAELNKTYRKRAFVRASRRLLPAVDGDDMRRSYTGIRAQVVDRSGDLLTDPLVLRGDRSVHVLNAVSPGFTSSLPFGEHVADEVRDAIA